MEKFNKICSSILSSIEDKSYDSYEDAIIAKVKELGISDEGLATLLETNNYLDQFDHMYNKLSSTKARGTTRSAWLQEEILNIGNKHNLEGTQIEDLIDGIADECKASLNATLEKGE